jgi:2-oxoglutarate dehydrogenase E1 component
MDEVCIGMPHRGRLNVLANIAGKSYAQIFKEFEGAAHEDSVQGSGDVKYHLGSEGVYTAPDGSSTKVYLAANPSHLEAVDPVLEGIVRAKQDILDRGSAFPVLPLLMHGDAAFAGQGVVAETLNLSQLRGYRTGGTIHLIVNNQVGFTTSPAQSRSSVYATDAARVIQAPILHVNGDDPEACVRSANLAFEFRQRFHKDVVIDLVCYRRRGHNEADDPSLTNPLMYNLIDQKRSVRKIYTEALIGRGDITLDEAEQALRDFQGQLERVFAETRDDIRHPAEEVTGTHKELDFPAHVDTSISENTLKHIASGQVTLPDDLTVHNRLRPQLERRMRMIEDDVVDWAMAETLAFGSLLMEGRTIRLAGQDSRRGTFGQRHAVIVDRITGEGYAPLQNLTPEQGRFYVYDSMLSEFAALGFEYGYSVARPEALVLWEAQFGDFANGAQTIMDEFLSSGEQKWQQTSGVVMLLPHGYEGQGPDHSSARIERYLQLCAQGNMTVSVPSTPASYFHLLRWQALSPHHKPLVVFTPKSMLRNKRAVSPAAEFTKGQFQPVIDSGAVDPAKVRRIVLCSGKVTWDLIAAREARGIDDIAILRLERLYPLPGDEVAAALATYPAAAEIMWVQEEPMNQGAYQFLAINLPEFISGRPLLRATRPPSASPATGSHKAHELEQAAVVDEALG